MTLVENRDIRADLFENEVDSARSAKGINVGYNDVTIDLKEDIFDLLSYDTNHNWWDKLWDYGFSWPETDGACYDVAPIQILQASDLVGTAESISDRLLVNRDDVSDIQALYADAVTVNPLDKTDEEKVVVLFRFAVSDYFSSAVGRTGVAENNADTYVAQQTMSD